MAPMDGITDPAFRAVLDTTEAPSVLYTEFVSADGLCRNPKRLLRTFQTHKTKTPLVGQLFGSDPKTMAEAAALLLTATSVVGIDINMGCPNRRVASHGGGAALIKKPAVAQKLIGAVGEVIAKSGKTIGLSVKTRIGYDTASTGSWIPALLEAAPDAIALHGRTLKQQYTGRADWKEIGKAADLAKKTHTLLLGNGDIASRQDALDKARQYSPDGVLIGRASLGNPWIFGMHSASPKERIKTAIRHCEYFQKLSPTANPLSLRKHLAWYIKGFDHAAEIRARLMRVSSAAEAIRVLQTLYETLPA